MGVGSLLLLGLFVFPLWKILLGAPQYPEPIGLYIHIDGLQDVNPHDIKNIDIMNHYIGMKPLPTPDEMWEFSVFPIVILGMSALGLLIAFLGYFKKVGPWAFMAWFVLMSILGIAGMYDFNLWLIDYGSNLDPHAMIKVVDTSSGAPMTYKPPLFGYQKLLNFDVYSYPSTGGYAMFVGMAAIFLSYFVGKRAKSA